MFKKLFIKIGIFLTLIISLLTANTTYAANFGGSPSATLSNNKAGETTTYRVDFRSSPTGALVADDQITIGFPAGFDISGVSLDAISGITGTTTLSVNGQNAVLTLDAGSSLSADTAVSVSLAGIINNQTTGSLYQLTITSTHLGSTVDGPTDTSYFSIWPNAPNQVQSSINTAGGVSTIVVGNNLDIEFTLHDQYGNAISNEDVSWTVSNSNFLLSSSTGVTNASGKNTVTLTAPTTAGQQTTVSAQSGTVVHNITVTTQSISTVHDAATSISITPVGPLSMTADDSQAFVATASDQYGNTWDITNDVTWHEDDPTGYFIDATYYAGSVGSWTIYATYSGLNSNNVTANVSHGVATSIDVTPNSATITAGNTQTYTVTATDADGNSWDVTASAGYAIDTNAHGTWASNVYTSETAGDWTVTATLGALSDTASLHVDHAGVDHIVVSTVDTIIAKAGGTRSLTVNAYDVYGNCWTVTSLASYSLSSDDLTGYLNDNVYTGGTIGTHTITASYNGKTSTLQITVASFNDTVNSVEIINKISEININGTHQYQVRVKDAYGNLITGRTITWTVTGAGSVSVDANGLMTGLTVGSVTVRAAVDDKYSENSLQVVITGGVAGFTASSSNSGQSNNQPSLTSQVLAQESQTSSEIQTEGNHERAGKITAAKTNLPDPINKFPYINLILLIITIGIIYLAYTSFTSNKSSTRAL